jgi:PPM family protein phosphatase
LTWPLSLNGNSPPIQVADCVWVTLMNNHSDDRLQKKLFQWLNLNQESKVVEVDGTGISLGSAVGLARKENQDRVLFLKVKLDRPPRQYFSAAILCDGMGGMAKGGYCANLALSVFATSLIRSEESDYSKKLETAAHDANDAVFGEFSGDGGTTLSAVICNDTQDCWAINVGDSRIYQMLADGKIEQLSVDDTIEGQLEVLNRHEKARPPEFRQLVQYVGLGKELEPHHIQLKPLNDAKLILLTSDGVHNMPQETFKQLIVNAQNSAKIVVKRLIEHSEWIGGNDNATVIAIHTSKGFGVSETDDFVSGTVEIWGTGGKVEIWTPSVVLNGRLVSQPASTKQEETLIPPESKKNPQRRNPKGNPELKEKNGRIISQESIIH